jgi:hypothetical protein
LLNVDNSSFAGLDLQAATSRQTLAASLQAQDHSNATEKINIAMRDLWSLLNETCPGSIPPGIIFLSGARLPFEGFGWAPQTWMTGREVDYPDPLAIMTTPAMLTEKGLLVQYQGYLLHAENRNAIFKPNSQNFSFPVDSTLLEWYVVNWQENDEVVKNARKGIMEVGKPSQLAIILCRPRPREISEIALLVEIAKPIIQRNIGTTGQRETKVYHVHIVRQEVKTNRLSQWRDSITQSIRDPATQAIRDGAAERGMDRRRMPIQDQVKEDMAMEQEDLIFGEVLDSSQKWYVDGRPPPKLDRTHSANSDNPPPRPAEMTTVRSEEPLWEI